MTFTPAASYGIATLDEIIGMTGKEFLQAISEGKFPRAPISMPLTFHLVEVGDGFVAFEGEAGPHLRSPLGTVHGGWALTLIDSATGCAGHTLLPAGMTYATVETKANFTRPIMPDTGHVRAEGRVVSPGRRIMTAEARVTDTKGRILAHGTSTLMVLPLSKPEDETAVLQ